MVSIMREIIQNCFSIMNNCCVDEYFEGVKCLMPKRYHFGVRADNIGFHFEMTDDMDFSKDRELLMRNIII